MRAKETFINSEISSFKHKIFLVLLIHAKFILHSFHFRRQMAATSAALDASTKELIIDGVVRQRLSDASEAAVIMKLVRNVLLDGVSIEDATRKSLVAADTLKDHVEAALVEMDKAAKEPR